MIKINPISLDVSDAFGQMLWDYYHGEEAAEIIERSDGYISAGFWVKSYFSEYGGWPIIEKRAISFARGRVLDIGCGAGRHGLYLQNKGLDVVGIDKSPLVIKLSKLRGLKQATALSLEDIGHLKLGEFDSIIMFGHNFGLFGNFKKAKRFLRRFLKLTTQQGRIIAVTRNPYQTKVPEHLEYQRVNREKGRMPGQMRLRVRYKNLASPWSDYLLVSESELEQIVKNTGWEIKKLIHANEDSLYAMVLEKE